MKGNIRPGAGFAAALLSLALLAQQARALTFEEAYEGNYARAIDAQPAPAAAPQAPEPVPAASAELSGFWEKLRKGTIEQVCRKAQLELRKEVRIPPGVAGLGGGVKRAIRKFPDGKLALIDEIRLDLSAGVGRQMIPLPEDPGPGLAAGLYGRIEGRSQVVRPLAGSDSFCRGALQIAKFYGLKTVLPASAGRLASMEVGEIWKVPLTMNVAFGFADAGTIGHAVTVSLSAGVSRQRGHSVTLRRLDRDKLRLRLRLDRVTVRSAGMSVALAELPLDVFGLQRAGEAAAAALGKAAPKAARGKLDAGTFDKLLREQINDFLSLKLSLTRSRFSGKQLLLEYILNPGDRAQMESLERFLDGDLGPLSRILKPGAGLRDFSEDDDALYGLDALEEAAEQNGAALGAEENFAGTDIYSGRTAGQKVHIPVVGGHSSVRSNSYHRYQSVAKAGETIHVHQRSLARSDTRLELPVLGALTKHNSQRDVIVLNKESAGGGASGPVLLFQLHEGLIGRGAGAAGRMLERAADLMRYVGAGGGDNGAQLPVDDIVGGARSYRSAVMSFKLLISERGVMDILAAPPRAVMQAYLRVMREVYGGAAEIASRFFMVNRGGLVVYDRQALARALADAGLAEGADPTNIIDAMAEGATRLIGELAGLRAEPDWKSRSEKLAGLAGGASRSGLKYEEIFKVVLQLVRRQDVSASVYVHLDPRKKGLPDVTQNHSFFDSRNGYDATLSEVTLLRGRFAAPSELDD